MTIRPLLLANFSRIVGGGEISMLELAAWLCDHGHRPIIALPGQSTMADGLDRCIVSPSLVRGAADIRYLARDVDVIHAQGARGLVAAWMAHSGKPIIWHARVADRDKLDPMLMRLPDLIIANSLATAQRFSGKTNVRVIYNAVGEPQTPIRLLPLSSGGKRPRPAPMGRDTGGGTFPLPASRFPLPARRIAVIGRMTPEKGIQDLLPALEEIAHRRKDVEIIFVGDDSGPIGDLVRDAAVRWPENIQLLGPVTDIANHMREFNLIVIPSRVEGFGRVAVESLRAGVPVTARKIGALPEVLSELKDPWLPENVHQWANKILADLDAPPDTVEELQCAGSKFSPDKHGNAIVAAYEAVILGY